ncbi:hypothetical protein G3D81_001749 [Campylobacter upsaliensis]|nr:hypothetical protein [Campylobacter upsaliensis]EDP7907329.1 hypothetical protein [Campylobacter upsaliensis]
MACIKDLESYSNENLKTLQKELENIDFKARVYAKEPSTAICGFIYDLNHKEKKLTQIIDNINKQNKPKKSELQVLTYLKKAYFNKLYENKIISTTAFSNFMTNLLSKNSANQNKGLKKYFQKLFNKQYVALRNQDKRIKASKLTKALCEKYPQLQVEKAVRYAVLCSKFELKQEDFEDFENIIKLLIQSPQETKEIEFI